MKMYQNLIRSRKHRWILLIFVLSSILYTISYLSWSKMDSDSSILMKIFNWNDYASSLCEKYSSGGKEKVVANMTFILNPVTHAYEVDSKPIIWTYWSNETVPDHVKIFVESIQCVNKEFRVLLLHDSTVGRFWPDYPEKYFHLLIPNHRSDLLRVALLKLYGGIWMDVDTYALQSMYIYYELLGRHDLVGSFDTEVRTFMAMGHIGPARANLPYFKMWSQRQLEILHGKMAHFDLSTLQNISVGQFQWNHTFIDNNNETMIKNNNETVKFKYPFGWTNFTRKIFGRLGNWLVKSKSISYYCLDSNQTVGQLEAQLIMESMNQPLVDVPYLFNGSLQETPLLYNWHANLRDTMARQDLKELLKPENETVFGFFAKCALESCFGDMKSIPENDRLKGVTHLTGLNTSLLHEALRQRTTNSVSRPCYRWREQTLLKPSPFCSNLEV